MPIRSRSANLQTCAAQRSLQRKNRHAAGKLLESRFFSVNPNEASGCWLWQGDRFEPSKGLPLSDRGFRYGMSVFETVRVHDGLPVFWEAHVARLLVSSAACGLPVSEQVLARAKSLLSPAWTEGVLRLYVTAGDGSPTSSVLQSRTAVLWESRRRDLPQSYVLETSSDPHLPLFGGQKTGNYWANARSLGSAHGRGADEAPLFTPDNHLTGCCMANAFVLLHGVWRTPPAGCGAREGVVRQWVLDHFEAVEAHVSRDEMALAEGVFLTSSWLGVMPARQLDRRGLCIADRVLDLRQTLEAEMQRTAR